MKEKFTVQDKISAIRASESLASLPLSCMPPARRSDEYYFISYSQKDYKKVYEDIFLIWEEIERQKAAGELDGDVSLWYDREMQAGKDWKQIADDVIFNYKCKGVIFYISENSLLSPAIHKEMDYARTHNKPCFTINLPIESAEKYRGREMSARRMLDALIENGEDVDGDKYDYILDCFPDDVVYLGYSRMADAKVGQMKKLKRIPLFDLGENGRIIAIKDTSVREVGLDEFGYVQSLSPATKLSRIANCLFANCRRLERAELPKTVTKIKTHAFMGCVSLRYINLDGLENLTKIGDFAFYHCLSLESLRLPSSLTRIGKGAFFGCTGLKSVTLPEGLTVLEDYAFKHCASLQSVTLPKSTERIGRQAFYGCGGLKTVYLPSSLKEIGDGAFDNCPEVEKVYYDM